MATAKIVVSPNQLDSVAKNLIDLAGQYKGHVSKLAGARDGTKANWNGDDNVAFINQLKRYDDDFTAMEAALRSYAAHLTASAKAYRANEAALAAEAKTKSHGLGN